MPFSLSRRHGSEADRVGAARRCATKPPGGAGGLLARATWARTPDSVALGLRRRTPDQRALSTLWTPHGTALARDGRWDAASRGGRQRPSVGVRAFRPGRQGPNREAQSLDSGTQARRQRSGVLRSNHAGPIEPESRSRLMQAEVRGTLCQCHCASRELPRCRRREPRSSQLRLGAPQSAQRIRALPRTRRAVLGQGDPQRDWARGVPGGVRGRALPATDLQRRPYPSAQTGLDGSCWLGYYRLVARPHARPP